MKTWLSLDDKKKRKKKTEQQLITWFKIIDTLLQVYYSKKKQGKQVMESREEEAGTSNQVGIKNGSLQLRECLWQLQTLHFVQVLYSFTLRVIRFVIRK